MGLPGRAGKVPKIAGERAKKAEHPRYWGREKIVQRLSLEKKALLALTLIVVGLLLARAINVARLPEDGGSFLLRLGQDAARLWTTPYFKLGTLPITPEFLVKMLVFLCILLVVGSRISRAFRRLLDRTSLEEGQKYAVDRALTYLVFVIGLLIGLDALGLNLSSLAVFGGAIGIGIGFGLQSIMTNFVSGLILLLERPIKVGDRVEIAGLDGVVVRIGARSTWVRTNDNIVMILPNSEFVLKPVVNWTALSRQVRFRLPFSVPGSMDPSEVTGALVNAARAHPDVLDEPPPEAIVTGFADKNLNYELCVWTTVRVDSHRSLKSELNQAVFTFLRDKAVATPEAERPSVKAPKEKEEPPVTEYKDVLSD
jgi:small-conductance mechanosensitive channel